MDWSEHKQANYNDLQWVQEKTLIELVAKRCGQGEALLELGCGTGVMIGRLAREFGRCVGVDPTERLIARAPRGPNIVYVPERLEDVGYENEFDCVVIRNTLHHLEDPAAGIDRAMKALRPGGRLVVCEGVPPDSRVKQFYTDLFKLFDSRHILTEADIVALLRLSGFTDIRMEPFFMERVDLLDWLRKVSGDEETFNAALAMHREGDSHLRRVYEMNEEGGRFTMTWRFVVARAVKVEES